MPAIPISELLGSQFVQRSVTAHNATDPGLAVICAWPVSGQYGPGTRVLYYVLVAACVFARKAEWIRNAGLAAVLLFPAVAALHGIVLAALHREGAVDMDVYGAFQLCSIGILTAPATVRLSKTYFNNPGRDIIFLWTGLILAGLLSLTVEFIRLESTICPPGDPATIQWLKNGTFSYESKRRGLSHPLRQGAAANIYVIEVPHELSFNTATLLAAACCVPAILSLVSTWIKILEKNWEKLSARNPPTEKPDEQPISGTNGATPKQMNWIAMRIRSWLTLIEIPVFFAAVLAILVKGEMNFFSKQLMYQTEPITSIGQWAPIVGTALAAVGSLYLLLTADMDAEQNQKADQEAPSNAESGNPETIIGQYYDPDSPDNSPRHSSAGNDDRRSEDVTRTMTSTTISQRIPRTTTNHSEISVDPGGRRIVARWLNFLSMQMAAKAHDQFQDSGFHAKERSTFPEVPGEEFRNNRLPDFHKAYSNSPIPRSRASSFIGSESSNGEGNSRIPVDIARHLSLPGPSSSRPVTRPQHAYTLPSRTCSSEASRGLDIQNISSVQRASIPTEVIMSRPDVSRASSTTNTSPGTPAPSGKTPPKIVVSSNSGFDFLV
ncbi:hypothetical protein N7532_005297 [Penicillium argentinense]|uniref:Uncharacterized protein n=1 Tax=Penicillium argentinense TaxID=1131581 RepID=A0A9W9KA85_9EURO|nr:uncharacterized protein N7532_005297 [Penicillium argentinense]KAJ5098296.1 hypothetical protein N7532_005297 [Penicillium argentinense]